MKTILLVDDDEMIRYVMSVFLADKYNVLEASDGQEGLNLFKENYLSIDLIITDFMMPTMNGLEMVKAICSLSQKVKIIMLSGFGTNLQKSLEDSSIKIDKLLSKPIDGDEIEKIIIELGL
ncbi:MAG: response regulator [Thaumarchaeota archaeon]|nr:response regulator [Nitrososphaerota archaeon]